MIIHVCRLMPAPTKKSGEEIHERSNSVQRRRPSRCSLSEFHEFGNSFRHRRVPGTSRRLWPLSSGVVPIVHFACHLDSFTHRTCQMRSKAIGLPSPKCVSSKKSVMTSPHCKNTGRHRSCRRDPRQQHDSILEEALKKRQAPCASRPGGIPSERTDLCGFVKPPNSHVEWLILKHGAFKINREDLGLSPAG